MRLKDKKVIISIDATSTVSGGGLTYLKEFIANTNPKDLIEIICSKSISKSLVTHDNVIFKTHSFLNSGIFKRVFFQIFIMDKLINKDSKILISLSGDYLGKFKPYIGVCQNMLLYEDNKTKGMHLFEKLKFKILRIRQIRSFNNSNGIIFLSKHAKNVVFRFIKENKYKIINFGISERFYNINRFKNVNIKNKFLYVSSIHTYKKQLNLLKAFQSLSKLKYNFTLTLVGSVLNRNYYNKIKKLIDKINIDREIVKHEQQVDFETIHSYYNSHDIFIFPSICENMPNILIEAMASGLPILSSKYQPMPEFLENDAIFFDPDDEKDTQKKIVYSISNYQKMRKFAYNNIQKVKEYNWTKNYNQTISFINEITRHI